MAERQTSENGSLRSDALGFRQALTLSIASPAPAYALAVTVGLLIATAGQFAPAMLILGFGLMASTAVGGYFLNRVDPDCGTVFHWSRHAFGSTGGFMGGLLIVVAGILVSGILAQTAGFYFFELVGWTSAAGSTTALNVATVLIMATVTLIAYLGIQLSVRTELILLWTQILSLLLLAVVAIVKIALGDAPDGSESFSLAWLSPFDLDSESLVQGVLLAVFMYAGWDTGLTVAEETRDPRRAGGRAGLIALVSLLVLYLIVICSITAFAGSEFLGSFGEFGALETAGTMILGSTLGKIVILAVMLSSLATAESAVLAQARTLLSMSRDGAIPAVLSKIHPRYRIPSVGTIFAGSVATVWFVFFIYASETFLFDSLVATSLIYAGFYGLIAVACLVYYRRLIFTSARMFVLAGLLPLGAALGFLALLIKSAYDLTREIPEVTTYWLGVQPPLVIAAGIVVIGLVYALVGKLAGVPYFNAPIKRADASTMPSEGPIVKSEIAREEPDLVTVGR